MPTSGSRTKLQARHERWVVVYNSNFQDQAHENRRSLKALRAELLAWEKEREKDEKERARAMERSGNGGSKDSGTNGLDYEVGFTRSQGRVEMGAFTADDLLMTFDDLGMVLLLYMQVKHEAQFRTLIEQARASVAKAQSRARDAEDPVVVADRRRSPTQEPPPNGNFVVEGAAVGT